MCAVQYWVFVIVNAGADETDGAIEAVVRAGIKDIPHRYSELDGTTTTITYGNLAGPCSLDIWPSNDQLANENIYGI